MARYRAIINDDTDFRIRSAIFVRHHRGSSSSTFRSRDNNDVTFRLVISRPLCLRLISLALAREREKELLSRFHRKSRANIGDLILFSRYEYRAVTIWLAVSLHLYLHLTPSLLPSLPLSPFSLLLSRSPAFGTKFRHPTYAQKRV